MVDFFFYRCRIQITSTDVENINQGESIMKTRTTKFMTLMTVATFGIFSAGTVMAAGDNDFYTQPPAVLPGRRQIQKALMPAIQMAVIM